MAERRRDDRDRVVAVVATIVLQLALGLAVLQLKPTVSTASASRRDDAIRVEFIRRTTAPQTATRDTPRLPVGAAVARTAAVASKSAASTSKDAPADARNQSSSTGPAALDLHVREPSSSSTRFDSRDVFTRSPGVDARRTRFEHAWAPSGNVLEQARFRSKAAGVALGLFGGPPRKCSEVERRLRKPDCISLHGQEFDDELARTGGEP